MTLDAGWSGGCGDWHVGRTPVDGSVNKEAHPEICWYKRFQPDIIAHQHTDIDMRFLSVWHTRLDEGT